MSRYALHPSVSETVVYGFDHALGYFFELWRVVDDVEQLLIDESSLVTGLTGVVLADLLLMVMGKFKTPYEHTFLATLDMPF